MNNFWLIPCSKKATKPDIKRQWKTIGRSRPRSPRFTESIGSENNMSKFQTIDALKGNKTINVNEYFKERWGKLEETKRYWGGEQTAVDEKFFNEKQYTLREQADLFRVFAESLGFDRDIKSLDIHISFSEKSEETE